MPSASEKARNKARSQIRHMKTLAKRQPAPSDHEDGFNESNPEVLDGSRAGTIPGDAPGAVAVDEIHNPNEDEGACNALRRGTRVRKATNRGVGLETLVQATKQHAPTLPKPKLRAKTVAAEDSAGDPTVQAPLVLTDAEIDETFIHPAHARKTNTIPASQLARKMPLPNTKTLRMVRFAEAENLPDESIDLDGKSSLNNSEPTPVCRRLFPQAQKEAVRAGEDEDFTREFQRIGGDDSEPDDYSEGETLAESLHSAASRSRASEVQENSVEAPEAIFPVIDASRGAFWVIYSYPDIKRGGQVKLELKFKNTTPFDEIIASLSVKFALSVTEFEPGCRLSNGPKELREFNKDKHAEVVALIGSKCLPPRLKSGKWGKPPCKNIPSIEIVHLPDATKEKDPKNKSGGTKRSGIRPVADESYQPLKDLSKPNESNDVSLDELAEKIKEVKSYYGNCLWHPDEEGCCWPKGGTEKQCVVLTDANIKMLALQALVNGRRISERPEGMVFDDNQILPRAASSGHGALPARPQGGQFQHLFRERQQRGNFAVPQTIYIQAPAQAPVPPPTPGASRLVDPNIEYPRIDSWLLDLDLHPKRGAENLNFAQYAPYFEAGAYKTIVQLEDLTMAEYKEYVSQAIPGGVISAIKKYVKEDIILLKRAAANRASQILGY